MDPRRVGHDDRAVAEPHPLDELAHAGARELDPAQAGRLARRDPAARPRSTSSMTSASARSPVHSAACAGRARRGRGVIARVARLPQEIGAVDDVETRIHRPDAVDQQRLERRGDQDPNGGRRHRSSEGTGWPTSGAREVGPRRGAGRRQGHGNRAVRQQPVVERGEREARRAARSRRSWWIASVPMQVHQRRAREHAVLDRLGARRRRRSCPPARGRRPRPGRVSRRACAAARRRARAPPCAVARGHGEAAPAASGSRPRPSGRWRSRPSPRPSCRRRRARSARRSPPPRSADPRGGAEGVPVLHVVADRAVVDDVVQLDHAVVGRPQKALLLGRGHARLDRRHEVLDLGEVVEGRRRVVGQEVEVRRGLAHPGGPRHVADGEVGPGQQPVLSGQRAAGLPALAVAGVVVLGRRVPVGERRQRVLPGGRAEVARAGRGALPRSRASWSAATRAISAASSTGSAPPGAGARTPRARSRARAPGAAAGGSKMLPGTRRPRRRHGRRRREGAGPGRRHRRGGGRARRRGAPGAPGTPPRRGRSRPPARRRRSAVPLEQGRDRLDPASGRLQARRERCEGSAQEPDDAEGRLAGVEGRVAALVVGPELPALDARGTLGPARGRASRRHWRPRPAGCAAGPAVPRRRPACRRRRAPRSRAGARRARGRR